MLDVGDGACSVLREHSDVDAGHDRTAIIDCGSNSWRGRRAAGLLAAHLSPPEWHSLSELVVTHFDADHWEGLLHVVDKIPGGSNAVPRDLCIYFPAVPFGVDSRLPAGVMALITTAGRYGVQALDLRAAWCRVTRVHLRPLARGDSFPLAGRLHEVVWPPARLTGRTTQRLTRLLRQIEDEAEQLARMGYPRLRDGAPDAETCISQYGSGLRQFWTNHTDSHANRGNCVNTYDCGDIDCDLR